jgi:hypothetical protein
MSLRAGFVVLLSLQLFAQDLRKLPEWAGRAAMAAEAEPAPDGTDAWVLLDRTEFAYVGDGEIRTHHMRVVRILDDRGLGEAVYFIGGLGGKASRVKRLKGWNLRPDGELTELDLDSAVTIDPDADGEITTAVATGARLPRVVRGSLVAFESMESLRHPMGPTAVTGIMQRYPIRRWELEAVTSGGWFTDLRKVAVRLDTRHLAPWIKAPEMIPGKLVRVQGVPAIPRHEGAAPHARNALPTVTVRFQDPDFHGGPPTDSWDALAAWVDVQYQPRFQSSGRVPSGNKGVLESLRAIHQWMAKELTYKQVYLSPERGWLPDPGPDVVRHRYGDCKDLTCCLLSEAKGLGLEVHPVMALIGHGFIEEGEVPSFASFDHVISAVRLGETLGLPAEVVTPRGRFLLVDPTSRLTPLGWLPAYLRDRRVMLCTGGGADWLTVPEAAIQVPATLVTLDGVVDATGRCQASLTIRETADMLGLRAAMLHGGLKGLRDQLVAFLQLSPAATLDLGAVGDPLDLSGPFTVPAKVVQPEAVRREGREQILPDWGLPKVPPLIQKSGWTRQFPVLDDSQGTLEFRATYKLPFPLKPLLPAMDIQTPFRTLHWTVQATEAGGGSQLVLNCRETRRPVYFDFDTRDKGLLAWKGDRGLVLNLRNQGLAFHDEH